MKKLSLLIALVLLGAGCAVSNTQRIEPMPEQAQPTLDQVVVVLMNSQIVMEGNDIYFSGIKRGEISGQNVSLDLGDDLRVTFPGKPGDFQYAGHGRPEEADATMIHSIRINHDPWLSLSDFVTAAYRPYKPVDAVSYHCNGSLVKTFSEGADVPNFYCETNGVDFLSQYEFSTAGIGDFATGDAPNVDWNKIYIKKAGEKNVFVFLNLGSEEDGASIYGNETEKVAEASKKAYLDMLLAKSSIAERIKMADEFVKHLTITVKK